MTLKYFLKYTFSTADTKTLRRQTGGANLAPMKVCFIAHQNKKAEIFFSGWGASIKVF